MVFLCSYAARFTLGAGSQGVRSVWEILSLDTLQRLQWAMRAACLGEKSHPRETTLSSVTSHHFFSSHFFLNTVSQSQLVYASGQGQYGGLGIGYAAVTVTPTLVSPLSSISIIAISASGLQNEFSLVLSKGTNSLQKMQKLRFCLQALRFVFMLLALEALVCDPLHFLVFLRFFRGTWTGNKKRSVFVFERKNMKINTGTRRL